MQCALCDESHHISHIDHVFILRNPSLFGMFIRLYIKLGRFNIHNYWSDPWPGSDLVTDSDSSWECLVAQPPTNCRALDGPNTRITACSDQMQYSFVHRSIQPGMKKLLAINKRTRSSSPFIGQDLQNVHTEPADLSL